MPKNKWRKIDVQKFTRIDALHFDKVLSYDEKIKLYKRTGKSRWKQLHSISYMNKIIRVFLLSSERSPTPQYLLTEWLISTGCLSKTKNNFSLEGFTIYNITYFSTRSCPRVKRLLDESWNNLTARKKTSFLEAAPSTRADAA